MPKILPEPIRAPEKRSHHRASLLDLNILQCDILFGEGHVLQQDRSFAWD
ncbi:hypothetical protein [Desulfoglaeba alkanexedens]|nr:hypothetical protein [Desulfoglaeba alkanexedens]